MMLRDPYLLVSSVISATFDRVNNTALDVTVRSASSSSGRDILNFS